MKILAIIPARGGSKGVPGKNIYPILGKPLIHYTLEIATESENIDSIVLSTDSKAIIESCKDFNVDFHLRDSHLATDKSPVVETVLELLKKYEKEEKIFDAVMLLQPTSPIRTVENINRAISILQKNEDVNSVISVVEMDDVHPARMYWQKENEKLSPILSTYENSRRQDIPKALYRNGSIYLTRSSAIIKQRKLMVKPSMPLIMEYKYLLNIDDYRDIIIAEPLIKAWKENVL